MQPAEGIRFFHAAICAEVRDIEADAQVADAADTLAALDRRVERLGRWVKFHTDGEEDALYPELEQRAPHVGAAYLLDHVDEQALFAEIRAHLATARDASATTRAGELARVRRQTIALTEHLISHVRKEDTLITPLLVELFTPAEQGAQIGRMMARFPADVMAEVLPWLVGQLATEDRVSYVGMVQRTAPPERFATMCGWIRAGVDPAVWTALAAAVPGVA